MRLIPLTLVVGAVVLGAWVFRPAREGEAVGQASASEPAKSAADDPPWKRVLTGDDARRVEELRRKIIDLRKAGKHAEAQAPAREILEIRTRVQGADHWQTADTKRLLQTLEQIAALPADAQAELAEATKLDGEVHQFFQKGRYAEALPLLRRALDIRQRHLGDDHIVVAGARNDLAFFLDHSGRPAEAEPLFRQVLEVYGRVLGEEHPDTALGYTNVAGNLNTRGKHAKAEPLFRQALAIRRKVLGEEHQATAISYNNLAASLNAQGKHAEAESLYRQALAIRRRVLGEEHRDTATGYTNLAANLIARGRPAEAEPLFHKAVAICHRVLDEDHPLTIACTNNLAANLNAQGKHAEAEPLFRKTLAAHLRVLRADHARTASSYYNLAGNLHLQGKHVEAEQLFRTALAIRLKVLDKEHPDTAQSYNGLASSLDARGKHTEAEDLHRQALAIRCRVLGEEHPDTVVSYNNLANNLKAQGRYDEAKLPFDRALAINRKVLGENHWLTVIGYYNLGLNLRAQGRYDNAKDMLMAAAKSYEVARLRISPAGLERAGFGGKPSPLPELVACLARAGEAEDAWKYLENNLARGLLDEWSARLAQPGDGTEKKRQQELLGTLDQLDKQIVTLLSAKEKTEADAAKELALQKQRKALEVELDRLEAELAARHVYGLGRIQAQLPADAALLAWVDLQGRPKAADPNGEHWACLLRRSGPPVWVKLPGSGKDGAWMIDDDLLPGRVRQALDKRPADSEEDWKEDVKKLSNQRLAPLEKHLRAGEGTPAIKHLIVLPSRWMAGIPVEILTGQYTVSYAPSATMFAKLQEKRKEALAQGRKPARLLALGDPVFQRPDTTRQPAPTPPDHGALVVQVMPRSNADRSGVKPGDVLLNYAGTKLSGPADFAKVMRKTGETQSGKPGEETGIPVAVWREGKTLELTARPDLTSATISQKPAAEAIRAWRAGDELLQLTRGPAFEPLPGSRREVNAIAPLFDRTDKLLGSEASAQRLAELAAANRLKDYRFLHLATHGVMDDERHLMSALILAQDRLPDSLQRVLAGQEPDDGRLTAKQVLATWKLDADLVTLSACQTALGRYSGGDGYIGFSQALFLAGARSLVLSLWKVEDEVTALLMTRFYENLLGARKDLKQPLPKAQALEEAKRWLRGLTVAEVEQLAARLPEADRGELRRKLQGTPRSARRYEHPYYWSAFILIGDPN